MANGMRRERASLPPRSRLVHWPMRSSAPDDMTDLEHRAPVRTADHALALTRDDLVASMQAYRAGAGGRQMWLPAVGVFAGLGLGAILTFLADAFTWPLVLSPIFFVGGWTVSLISLAIVFRRTRRLTEQWQWNCLHCDAPLIAGR